jgi:hypothetical protein
MLLTTTRIFNHEDKLMGNKLGGTLPVELMQINTVRFLIIQSCCSSTIPIYGSPGFVSVGGRLPESIGMLTSLLVLELGFNTLSGTVSDLITSVVNCHPNEQRNNTRCIIRYHHR